MSPDQHSEKDSLLPDSIWRDSKRLLRIVISSSAVLLLALLVAYLGYPRFRTYQRQKTMRSAEAFFQAEDYRSAYLLLDQLTKKEPGNFEAWRLLARVLDAYSPNQALGEWEALTKREPGNPANFIGYATIALRAGQLDRLDAALAGLKKLQPASADYHRLAVGAAMARRDAIALRQALSGLEQADPGNPVSRFGRASLDINSTRPAEVVAARAALEEFARGKAMRIRATLVLLADERRRWPDKTPAQAHRLLAGQLGLGLATRAGEKQYLWAGVKDQHEPDLEDIIQHMQSQPAPISEEVVMLASWMIEQNKAREALVWLESLDGTVRSAPPVLNLLAACALIIGEWTELEKVLLAGAWGPVPAETVRYAFEARQAREAGNESKAESLWNNAVQGTETALPGLRMLVRLAGQWQWPRKQEQALWELVQNFPSDEAGWQKLSTLALGAKDSAKIWRIYSAWSQADSTNNQVRINRLVLGIFIRPAEPGLRASIDEIIRLTPSHPGAQLAQAMVYWRDNRWPEALALLDRIPLKPSTEPRLALARGLTLASLGRSAEAETMFAFIPSNVLLPEETALLAAARKRT